MDYNEVQLVCCPANSFPPPSPSTLGRLGLVGPRLRHTGVKEKVNPSRESSHDPADSSHLLGGWHMPENTPLQFYDTDASVSVSRFLLIDCDLHCNIFSLSLTESEQNNRLAKRATRVALNGVTNLISGVKIPVLPRTSIVTPSVQKEPQPKDWYTKQ